MKRLKPVIRYASSTDVLDLGTVQSLSWQAAYKGIIADDYLATRTASAMTERWVQKGRLTNTLIASWGNAAIGFASAGAARLDVYKNWGELYALYLHPDWYSKGVGEDLFKAAVAHIRTLSLASMYVQVLEKNRQGRRFYKKMGGLLSGVQPPAVVLNGVTYPEVIYEWRPLP